MASAIHPNTPKLAPISVRSCAMAKNAGGKQAKVAAAKKRTATVLSRAKAWRRSCRAHVAVESAHRREQRHHRVATGDPTHGHAMRLVHGNMNAARQATHDEDASRR